MELVTGLGDGVSAEVALSNGWLSQPTFRDPHLRPPSKAPDHSNPRDGGPSWSICTLRIGPFVHFSGPAPPWLPRTYSPPIPPASSIASSTSCSPPFRRWRWKGRRGWGRPPPPSDGSRAFTGSKIPRSASWRRPIRPPCSPGPTPVLLDEWQHVPAVWDAVRRAVDDGATPGRFLLTGSAAPTRAPTHSGAGRIVTVRMRPLALSERGIAEPTVSLRTCSAGDRERSAGVHHSDSPTTPARSSPPAFPGFAT